MPQTIIDLLNKGAAANRTDSFRQGNLILLPGRGRLVVSGDIHGHRRNFERIVSFASLADNRERHVVLQEIIHGGPADAEGGCISYKLLFDAVRYKLDFPEQVHIIMGNHDTAFINDSEVMKDGKEMNRSMYQALEREFHASCEEIKAALREFLFSEPLAVKTHSRIWISHSLPGSRYADKFDRAVLHRDLRTDDVLKPGSAYLLTWGRRHPRALLDKMSELFDADIFILGHQPQPQGWSRAGRNLIILASDHDHGCLLPIDLDRTCTADELADCIVPLASIP